MNLAILVTMEVIGLNFLSNVVENVLAVRALETTIYKDFLKV